MPLTLIRSINNQTLFTTCADRFLRAAAGRAHIWLTHRVQRDALLELALSRGVSGWLNPPINFLSALPQLFGITGKAIGTLTRRELISAIGYDLGAQHGIRIGNNDATITRGNMLDSFIGELLPEGVSPEQLSRALDSLDSDEFGRRRNAWLAAVYNAYLARLRDLQLHDPRAVHALVADRIERGELRSAIGGADQLHIYGLYSARARHRLLAALAGQTDVDVTVYTSPEARDIAQYAPQVEDLPDAEQRVVVQPAPDANRELQWVSAQVKQLILEQNVRPCDIAVVARTGQHDTRRALQALEGAGVPATARVRSRLSEVAALKAVLELFRGPAQDWSYRILRNLLASPYFRFRIDLRPFDAIACQARPRSLVEWERELEELIGRLEAESDPDARRIGLNATRVTSDLDRFRALRATLERLDGEKTLGDWIALTREFLANREYRFRQRVCDPPVARHDVVRIDQRGVRRFEALLAEWAVSDDVAAVMSPGEWFRSLRALLEGQELVLTTPGQKGVQVLEAHDAALAPFRAVFLIHANDGEFPRASSAGGLFSQEERAQLRALGLPLDDRRSTLERERVLWAAVCGAGQVTITYRTTDADGTPLLPSLMVPPHDQEKELPRSAESITPPLNAEHEARVAAARAYATLRNGAGRASAPDVEALRRAVVRAYAEQQRAGVSPWNGQLRDPVVLTKLSDRFSDGYVWSVSQLQTYTTCPFFFLIDRVLGLQAVEEADEDTNALASGGVAHEVLERFYREHLNTPIAPFDADRFDAIANTVFDEWERGGQWLGVRALWRQRRQWLLRTLRDFVAWDIEKHLSRGQTVFACEYPLGSDEAGLELNGTDVSGRKARLLLRGYIDRIDRNRKGELEVVDYKSGSMPKGKSGYVDGAVLQGPVYLHALVSQGHNAVKAIYRSLKDCGNSTPLKIDDREYATALSIAFTVPQRVRDGLFECVLAESAEKWSRWHPDLGIRRTDAIQDGVRW